MIFLPITPGIMHLARSCSARPARGPQQDFHRFVTGSKSTYLTFKLQWRPSVDLLRLKSLHSLWQPIQQVFLFFQRYHKISPAQRDPSFTSHIVFIYGSRVESMLLVCRTHHTFQANRSRVSSGSSRLVVALPTSHGFTLWLVVCLSNRVPRQFSLLPLEPPPEARRLQ